MAKAAAKKAKGALFEDAPPEVDRRPTLDSRAHVGDGDRAAAEAGVPRSAKPALIDVARDVAQVASLPIDRLRAEAEAIRDQAAAIAVTDNASYEAGVTRWKLLKRLDDDWADLHEKPVSAAKQAWEASKEL